MADVSDYRTPEELAEQNAGDARILLVLADAFADHATVTGLMDRDCEEVIVDLAVDRLHDRIRARLAPEDRVRAIVLLLTHLHSYDADALPGFDGLVDGQGGCE